MSAAAPDEADIHAYLRHQALARRADYVDRGRRFEALDLDALEAGWAHAFVAMCLHGEAARIEDLDDLSAEIALRGRPVPAHLVQNVMPGIRERARQGLTAQSLARFGDRVRAFLSDRAPS